MSIMVTYDQALTGTRFTFRISNPRHKSYGEERSCRRTGKTQTWKTRPGHFSIPVKYGLYESFRITHENAADFTCVDFAMGQSSDDLAHIPAR